MSAVPTFLPWQLDAATRWLAKRERFAHAWLIHGMPGIGKQQFALAAAASLLCETPAEGLACRTCQACQWVATGNHPDIRRIRPEALALHEGEPDTGHGGGRGSSDAKKVPSREIRIEQLRELYSWFNTATHRGGWRVAVLYPAQALNVVSANALLKVLEEPPAHTVFLLVADAPDRLLPTLVSRCRRLPLPVPPNEASVQWLSEQGISDPFAWLAASSFAPVRARQTAQEAGDACPTWLHEVLHEAGRAAANPDVGSIADQLEKVPAHRWLDSLQRLFVDLLLAHSGLGPRYFPALETTAVIARHASLQQLVDTARWLSEQRAVADHPLNAKLFVHTVLQRAVLACQAAR